MLALFVVLPWSFATDLSLYVGRKSIMFPVMVVGPFVTGITLTRIVNGKKAGSSGLFAKNAQVESLA